MKARILVVDDDKSSRMVLEQFLRTDGFETSAAGSAEEALELVSRESFDVCISDLRMPGMDGIELLRRLTELAPETLVIIVTAHGVMESSIAALRAGAADYILKPILAEDILNKVRRLVEHRSRAQEVRALRRLVAAVRPEMRMVGESAALRRIDGLVARVADTGSTVLITGESGTGKELVADAIHRASPRAHEPFVPVNCAAISESLLESELFGHVRGAFTGAVAGKEGLLQTAGAGTLFLDEVGDMALPVQAKLLRTLENREIQPLGSVRRTTLEARIVAATNKNLEEEIAEGRFRDDLYYRLAVVEIEVPPLRRRREDIPPLIDHFVERHNRELRRTFNGISNAALHMMMGYDWKGNVRELENVIERAMIVSEGPRIEVEDLPEAIRMSAPIDPEELWDLRRASHRFELSHINGALEHCAGDKKKAARLLGMSLSSLYRKLESELPSEASASTSGRSSQKLDPSPSLLETPKDPPMR